MPDNDALNPGAEPKDAQPPASEPTDWQAQAAEWEKRAKGWQRQLQALQKEQETVKSSEAQLKQSVADWQSKYGTLEGEKGVLDQQLDELTEEMGKLTTAYGQTEASLQKINLIREEFPNLFDFSDMIPTIAEEEQQLATLKEWDEALTSRVENLAQQRMESLMKGITPPASPLPGKVAPSEEELRERLSQIAGRSGYAEEYERLLKQWGAIKAK